MKYLLAAMIAAFAIAGSAQAHMLPTSTPPQHMTAKQQLRYAHLTIAHSKATIAMTKRRIRADKKVLHALKVLHAHPRLKGWVEISVTRNQYLAALDLRKARIVLHNHRWLLGYGRRLKRQAEARMNPWTVPRYFVRQALCVHRGPDGHSGEGAWNANTGNGFGGGLQFMVGTWNHAASRSRGKLPHVSSTGQIAALPPAAQIYAAYVIVVLERSGWGQWPNTARRCGLL